MNCALVLQILCMYYNVTLLYTCGTDYFVDIRNSWLMSSYVYFVTSGTPTWITSMHALCFWTGCSTVQRHPINSVRQYVWWLTCDARLQKVQNIVILSVLICWIVGKSAFIVRLERILHNAVLLICSRAESWSSGHAVELPGDGYAVRGPVLQLVPAADQGQRTARYR